MDFMKQNLYLLCKTSYMVLESANRVGFQCRKEIDRIDFVQRFCTRDVIGSENLSFQDRLHKLSLESFE